MFNERKAIIFDLDGTLWDSSEEICYIWNVVLKRHKDINYELTIDDVMGFMGKTIDEIIDSLFPNINRSYIDDVIDECSIEEVDYLKKHGAKLYPYVEDTLKKLCINYDLYIVSNCQNGYIDAFLTAHNLGKYFKDTEMFGRNGLKKADNIKLIIERNNIKHALYVGDTLQDETETRKAGIKFIHARYGFGKSNNPDAYINNFCDLLDVIETIDY